LKLYFGGRGVITRCRLAAKWRGRKKEEFGLRGRKTILLSKSTRLENQTQKG